ncbi:DEAD/DEAH box helicase [Shewanella algae]|uniref:DEAD/DEAH box helicase n=1 Tax=Shewanella algae TaxID=38313 RepID=UPI002232941B|nr:DEAD/DEAH box helicase [Shewanella algae]UZD56824.1 DEAD/DEAH box helicase [Shewanella algae]
MAFKKKGTKQVAAGSPDQLFRELPRRKFPDVLPHQQSMMQRYAEEAVNKPDVALQLPTGSGKTLVGLLIAEWRRRKYNEKIVYLCPTRQLVNQVVEQAESKYGLTVLGFTGKKAEYNPSDVAKYKQGLAVAITTYSSVFNTNPFFDDPDIVIVDDAHAAENYVSKLWSLEVERFNRDHTATHEALCSLVKPYLDSTSYTRLAGKWESPSDQGWVDKLPTPIFETIKEDLIEILDEYTLSNSLKYPWSMLRANLQACHLYMSSTGFLLRPLLPPTWAHAAFSNAKQRIYMSATLGEGGDLERLVGRKNIYRLATPDGWDTQGVGRRFFIFPSLSLNEQECSDLNIELFKMSNRSLVLVPSDPQATKIKEKVETSTSIEVFSASDIEESKGNFVNKDNAIAVVANRYDGIDFPGDECRLLVIEGLPKTVNFQEQFLMSRIGANILFNERIQTRVIQAIGRCTRSLEDYSAVVVNGNALVDFLADRTRRTYFHPELQAELEFGVEQSIDSSFDDLIENYEIFIENGEDWEDVNNEIVEIRTNKTKLEFPGISELSQCVSSEIDYVTALWSSDFEEALSQSERILGSLTSPELRGYRAMWEYLAGSAAYMADKQGYPRASLKAKEHFTRAKKAAKDIPWLVGLTRYANATSSDPVREAQDIMLMKQIEGIESLLSGFGCMHDRKLTQRERLIREGLNSSKQFEEAHRLLGEHLGFEAYKVEEDASPDPWWQLDNLCIVFEDHANAESDTLCATKARQVATHPNWIQANVDGFSTDNVEIIPVLISPVSKVKKGGTPHLNTVMFWKLDDFKEWASHVLDVVRELRTTFQQPGDLVWRADAAGKLIAARIDVNSIKAMLYSQRSMDLLLSVE